MGIVDEDIQAVRAAVDLVDLVQQYTQGKQVGRSWVGLCPFHAEKSGSFSVSREKGVFYCFGCQKQGDAITFVREIEQLDFVGAVEWLAGRTGTTLRYTDTREGETRKERNRLVEAMEAAVEWYHRRLLEAPDAGPARSYLRARGLDGDTVRAYRVGWAPEAWDDLMKALRLPQEVAVGTGLGFKNRAGRLTDAFRGRVLFPIYDPEGKPVAFGGRVLPGGEGPKYKNSPETKLYSKSKVLYGLNWHKGEIVAADEAVVCEGYTDVIGFARAGVPRAVATCGTALTEEHLRLLQRFARRVVLAFDADAAGQGAAERFYEWEKRLGLDVAVARLPEGVDPGDLAERDPEALRAAIAEAMPFLGFRVERALAAGNLSTPEGRARTAQAALAVIREHPDPLVRDQYVMQVADRCRIEGEQLRQQLAGGPRTPQPTNERRNDQRHPSPEVEALVLLVHRREEMEPWLDEVLFTDDRHVAVLRAVRSDPDLRRAVDALQESDPGAAEALARIAVVDTESEPDDVGARLVELASDRMMRAVEAEARTAEDPLAYSATLREMKLAVEALRDPHARSDASARLLPLLRARSEDGDDQ